MCFLLKKTKKTLLLAVILLVSTSCARFDYMSHSASPQTPKEGAAEQDGANEKDRKIAANEKEKEQKRESKKDINKDQQTLNEISRPTLAGTIRINENGEKIVTNPADLLVLVNKERQLPADYVPPNLVIPDVPFFVKEDVPKKYLRKVAARALEKMFAAAKKEGVILYAVSGYRSYERQKAVFAYNARVLGEEKANRVSAHPGESEHQTGLAMDISSEKFGNRLDPAFGQTLAGQWVATHAYQFGFIIRYPKGKQEITGYSYEPWHLRYVGKKAATFIATHNLTLEQYFVPPHQSEEGEV